MTCTKPTVSSESSIIQRTIYKGHIHTAGVSATPIILILALSLLCVKDKASEKRVDLFSLPYIFPKGQE